MSRKKVGKFALNTLLLSFCVVYLFPIYIIVVNAFKNRAELYENMLALPSTWDFQYFVTAFEKMNFLNAFKNSLLVTLLSIFFIVVLASMSAWMLVRKEGKLSSGIFMLYVATMLIPFQTLMMPLMQEMGFISRSWKIPMTDSHGGLVFMYIGFGAGMAVFLYHGFIKTVPRALEEAATIDGCSTMGVFWRIVFPVLKPTTMTVIILDVIWIWNDYLLPSLTLKDTANRTIPLSTFYFFGQFTIQWNLAMAGLVLTIIPVIIFYLCAQKYIIKGVAAGAVK